MHEYYLTEKDGNTIFSKPLQQDRLDYLRNEFELGRESINQDLSFEIPSYLDPRLRWPNQTPHPRN